MTTILNTLMSTSLLGASSLIPICKIRNRNVAQIPDLQCFKLDARSATCTSKETRREFGAKKIEEIDPFYSFPLSYQATNVTLGLLNEIQAKGFRISFIIQPQKSTKTSESVLAYTQLLSPNWIGISINLELINDWMVALSLSAKAAFSELRTHELVHAHHIAHNIFLSKTIQTGSVGVVFSNDFITDMLEWVEHERVFSSLKKQGIVQQ